MDRIRSEEDKKVGKKRGGDKIRVVETRGGKKRGGGKRGR